jgi:hypothetical protein
VARSGYLRDVVYNIGQDRKLGVYKPDLSEWLLQIYPIVAHIPPFIFRIYKNTVEGNAFQQGGSG